MLPPAPTNNRLPQTVDQFSGSGHGVSANQLAMRYHLSRGSVRRLLREAQILRRYQAMTDNEVDQAAELYQLGLTIAQVTAKLDRPWSTVQAAFGRRGVIRRSRHDYH